MTSPEDEAPAPATYTLAGAGRSELGMGIGRIIGLIFAGLLALISVGIIFTGAVLAWVHESRGADGFLSTSTEQLSTPTAALTSAKVDINVGGIGWFADHLGTIRITATSTSGKPVFIGIARRSRGRFVARRHGHRSDRRPAVRTVSGDHQAHARDRRGAASAGKADVLDRHECGNGYADPELEGHQRRLGRRRGQRRRQPGVWLSKPVSGRSSPGSGR